MEEIWKPVSGKYEEGHYEVSNLGHVRNTRTGNLLTPSPDYKGYQRIGMTRKNGRVKLERVHILVALAFLEKRPPGKEINHKNGLKDDNRAENLEWMTRAENIQHYYQVLRGMPEKKPKRISPHLVHGEDHRESKLTVKQVREIRTLLKEGDLTQTAIAERFNVTVKAINHIARGRNWAWLDCDEGLTHHRA